MATFAVLVAPLSGIRNGFVDACTTNGDEWPIPARYDCCPCFIDRKPDPTPAWAIGANIMIAIEAGPFFGTILTKWTSSDQAGGLASHKTNDDARQGGACNRVRRPFLFRSLHRVSEPVGHAT